VPLESFLQHFIFILPINIPPVLCFNSAFIQGLENDSLKAAGQIDKNFFNPIINQSPIILVIQYYTKFLSVFERKMLRKIFGPTKKANGIWRIKTKKGVG
jgi:hypothetical protein